MRKLFVVIGGVLIVGILGVLAVAFTRPDSFHVERQIVIKSPPEAIFAMIADFRAWAGWSPWEKRDPAMKRTMGGAEAGKGATYAWDGNNDVGAGRMEIIEATPPKQITVKLDFSRPIEAHDTARFTLEPRGDGTLVTWSMQGENPFLGKVVQVFISMDKMVGSDFEAGLAALKKAVEK